MPDKPIYTSVASSTSAIFFQMAVDGTTKEINYTAYPPDNHPVFALIGRVAAAWALLEHSLDKIVWALAGLDNIKGACLTAQMMGVAPRYSAITAQLTLRKEQELEFDKLLYRLVGLQNKTHDPQEKRNRIVHDVWVSDTQDQTTAQFRAWPRKQLVYGIRAVDLENILSLIAEIRKLEGDANGLYLDVRAAIASSLRKQQQPPP